VVGFRKQACLPPRVLRPDSAYLSTFGARGRTRSIGARRRRRAYRPFRYDRDAFACFPCAS